MRLLKAFLLLAFLSVPSISVADTSSEQEAETLLNIVGMEEVLEQSIAQMLDIQLQQNPALIPYRTVLMNFFSKHMSYESLKPVMVQMYAEEFTVAELREINRFYATDVGRKTVEKMPTLMAKGAQLGAARVEENIGELEAMIDAEAKRLEKLQSE